MSSDDRFDVNHTLQLPPRKPLYAAAHGRDFSIGGMMSNGIRANINTNDTTNGSNNDMQDNQSSSSTRKQRSGTIADYNESYTNEYELINNLSKSQSTSDDSASIYTVDDTIDELNDIEFNTIENDSLLHNVLAGTVDLRIYSAENDKNLHNIEQKLLLNIIENSANYCNLYESMNESDNILQSMESMLYGYQSDLTQISTEINNLQTSTKLIAQKLNNRKSAQLLLTQLISNVYITDDLIYTILNTELISEYFISGLKVLSTRIAYFDTNKSMNFSLKLYGEMYSIVNKLKLKAISRIRTFILDKLNELDNPRINLSAEKSSYLIYNYYIYFIEQYGDAAVYNEIQVCYVELMTKIYNKKFQHQMNQYKNNIRLSLWPNDLLTNEHTIKHDTSSSSIFGNKIRKSCQQLNQQYQWTQQHINALHCNYNESILVYDNKTQYELYTVYGYLINLFIESVQNELLFYVHFFKCNTPDKTELIVDEHTVKQCNTIFNILYDTYIQYLVDILNKYDYSGYQSIIILLYYIYQWNQKIHPLNRQLHNCLQQINAILWKKLKLLFESQLSCIRSYDNHKYTVQHDNYIIDRWIHIVNSIHSINIVMNVEILTHYSVQFADSIYSMLQRITASYTSTQLKLQFMCSQCMYICNSIKSMTYINQQNHTVYNYYNDKYLSYLNQFIESILNEYYGSMIQFLYKYEKASDYTYIDVSEIDQINNVFTDTYKTNIIKIEKYVNTNFVNQSHDTAATDTTNHINSTDDQRNILSSILIQLLLYYQRYIDCISKIQSNNKSKQFTYISPSTLIYEIKQYTK